jgi:hypothetical protein
MSEWNDGYIAEGCDRIHIVTDMIEYYLREHPAIKRAGCSKKINEAINLLNDCYQEVGQLDEAT